MQLEVTPFILEEVHKFINDGDLIRLMNDKGLEINSMSFILQAVLNALDDAQTIFDLDENM